MKKEIFQNLKGLCFFKKLQNEEGTTIFTLLVTLPLGFLCGVICYLILNILISTGVIISKDYERNYQNLRIDSIAEDLINDINLHPLRLAPHIFKNGRIKVYDQELVLTKDPKKQPASKSDIIAYLEINIKKHIKLSLNESLELVGCTTEKDIFKNKKFLGLDLRGITYYQVRTEKIGGDCYIFHLEEKANLIISERSFNAERFSKILIPINQEYLIYKDREDILRFVTLDGITIKENQPILENAPNLEFEIVKTGQIWELKINWESTLLSRSKRYSISKISRIARQAVENLILNL